MYQNFQEPPFNGQIPAPSNESTSLEGKDPTLAVELAFQHVMDCSIECPSPFSLLDQEGQEPETRVSVDVGAEGSEESFQVVVALRVEMMKNQKPVCIIELKYAGYFIIKNAKKDIYPVLLYVDCPNLLWPSVRHWVRVATLECGLPALQLSNVDFTELLRTKIEEAKNSDA